MAELGRKQAILLLAAAGAFLAVVLLSGASGLVDKPAPPVSELFWQMLDQAKWGEAEAQYAVGMMYLAGQGVNQDQAEGAKWVEKAAAQGHPYALFKMGEIYQQGTGVPKDLGRAAEFFKQAAQKGVGSPDEKAYYRQLFEAQMDLLRWKRDQDVREQDRKYEDKVRREQNQHEIDLQREIFRSYPGWWYDYPRPLPPPPVQR